MSSELIGVWDSKIIEDSIIVSEKLLAFKADQTGWLKIIDFQNWSVDLFEWTHTSRGWIGLAGIKRFERDKFTREVLQVKGLLDLEHMPYKISEECSETGEQLKVLHFDSSFLPSDSFVFLDANPENFANMIG